MTEMHWELLESVSGNLQAEIFRGLLEAQGIPVMLSQEGAGAAIGLSIGTLGLVEILVPSTSLARARQVMEDYYSGKFEQDEPFPDAGEEEI